MKRTLPTLCLLLAAGCNKHSSAPAPVGPGPAPSIQLGDPLPDLTPDQLASFQRGKAMFTKRFKPSEGLGPVYNATSCASCHSVPTIGGGADLYRNFYLAVWSFSPDQPQNLPGLPSPVVPAFGNSAEATFSLEKGRTGIPDNVFGLPVRTAQRNAIPIFGTGLFETISNATILANADPEDDDGDGISGRANNDGAGMGRFGVKAQSNNIEFFTRAPLMNQMGITTNPFNGSNGTVSLEHGAMPQASSSPNDPTRDADGVADPEMSGRDLGDLIAFSRFLAPPQPLAFDDAARRGESLFASVGCVKCHIPELQGSRGPVRAFTDLLIHDMGPALADNIGFGRPQAAAGSPSNTGTEFRSAPLWGVSHFAPYLHDGRAETLEEAIVLHGGEAEAIRVAYQNLTPAEQQDILSFLRHL